MGATNTPATRGPPRRTHQPAPPGPPPVAPPPAPPRSARCSAVRLKFGGMGGQVRRARARARVCAAHPALRAATPGSSASSSNSNTAALTRQPGQVLGQLSKVNVRGHATPARMHLQDLQPALRVCGGGVGGGVRRVWGWARVHLQDLRPALQVCVGGVGVWGRGNGCVWGGDVEARAFSSGRAMRMRTSKRPGRSSAASSMSARLVAATNTTPMSGVKPSISDSSCSIGGVCKCACVCVCGAGGGRVRACVRAEHWPTYPTHPPAHPPG